MTKTVKYVALIYGDAIMKVDSINDFCLYSNTKLLKKICKIFFLLALPTSSNVYHTAFLSVQSGYDTSPLKVGSCPNNDSFVKFVICLFLYSI